MTERIRTYEHEGLTVTYAPGLCIHAEECVRGLPNVFDPRRRPWIDPSQADAASIAATIRRCPTGALHYMATDAVPAETPDDDVTVEAVAEGPLYVRGDIRIAGPDGETTTETRVALCRCGASENKPYCDNSHLTAGFDHDGALGDIALDPPDGTEPPGVDVDPTPDGPFHLTGRVAVTGADGQRASGGSGWFCRCGGSENKPFCDGSHRRIGFTTG